MTEEELQLQKRIKDLANRSYKNGIYTFTGFLSLSEQNIFYSIPELVGNYFELNGGAEQAERRMLRFGSPDELGYEEDFPISCIEIKPLMIKFADKLTHRDVLGAIMNLGIERSMVGDIYVKPDVIFLLCHEKMSDYICKEITRIKHTSVSLRIVDKIPEALAPTLEEVIIHCQSLRIDGVIAKLYKISRNESDILFSKALVFINGKTITKSGIPLKEGDVVSVRGYGKFQYNGECRETKKGSLCIKVWRYV